MGESRTPSRGESIRIRGIVQGVGFRPMIWRLAQECKLQGSVRNDAEGVLIQVWGEADALNHFLHCLQDESPPLARIESIERHLLTGLHAPDDFQIIESGAGPATTGVSPDAATCPACLAEIFDSTHRRYRYPLSNCTHCGPRLSIINAIPYDRMNTTMAVFAMCPSCRQEYEDPSDRRFHAQPISCPNCGPQVWLEDESGQRERLAEDLDAVETAANRVKQGHILAIKGMGGIHLACDACNEQAVNALRQRKHRYHKAFALMAGDVDMVRRYASVSEQERLLLEHTAAPVVILEAGTSIAAGVAPAQNTLGFMLPYTPLHHLLMEGLENPIVLTSGNRSDEPQCIENEDARQRLNGIADAYLLHDRNIANRLDDSVLRVAGGEPRFLRRARGYAPEPIALPVGFEQTPPVLAMGGELKNTFCLLKDGKAVLSQHMGDLENAAAFKDYRYNLVLYQKLFDHQPEIIAVDQHPDYLSTALGREWADSGGLGLDKVQHHHAHIASCMVEHGLALETQPVLGIALDGLGLGEDRTLWGGEFLLADYVGFKRLARFQPIPMPGGTQAMREPWRNTYAHLSYAFGWGQVQKRFPDLDIVRFLETKPLGTLETMVTKGLNSPLASSCGRLFDAIAAAVGVCRETASYEGQAAIELEALASSHFQAQKEAFYPIIINNYDGVITISWEAFWDALLTDVSQAVTPGVIAARCHQALVKKIAELTCKLCRKYNTEIVVLGGGVFQNRLLLEGISERLQEQALTVVSPVNLPANDGGLSLGQAAVAAARVLRR